MTEGEGIVNEAAKEPTHKMVDKWLVEAYNSMLGGLEGMCGRRPGF